MKSPLHLVVSLAAVLAVGAPVSAQQARPERPYRGLFGGGVGDAQQLLTFSLSAGGGYDDNVFADQQGTGNDPRQAKAGQFGSASADLNYGFNSTDWSFGASGSTTTRYSPGLNQDFATGASVGVGLSAAPWTGARFGTSASVGYQPYYMLQLFPSVAEPVLGEAPVVAPEFGALAEDYLAYGGSANLSQSVSRRGSVAVSVMAQRSDFRSETRGDTGAFGAHGGYRHQLAKGLGLRLGYGLQEHDLAGGSANRVHSLDVGIDFNRALSLSRRTRLAFSTGSAAVRTDSSELRYHLTGGISLNHEVGRTWSASLGYTRAVQLVEALGDSYVADGASAAFGGLMTRRLEFSSQASVGFASSSSRGNSDFDTYMGAVGLKYALTRPLALGVNYSYYRYAFAQGAIIPPGFGRNMDRQSVTASLSFWAPILYRARRPDAPR